jgi:hypothetical protein
VKQQSLARVAQLLGAVGEEKEANGSSEYDNEFEGDEVDDDLVFSTVPQRSSNSTQGKIHFDEIDDEEMRRFAESFEQEQKDTKMDENDSLDDDQLCQDYQRKMKTPTKSTQKENNKRKQPSIEDLDALLNDDDDDDDNEDDNLDNQMDQQEQMSPVFKKKP